MACKGGKKVQQGQRWKEIIERLWMQITYQKNYGHSILKI